MVTLDATPGGSSANSYETALEAQAYWDSRLFTDNWDNSDDQDASLIWATRVLDSQLVGHRTLIRPTRGAAYYLTAPEWEGTPASSTQRLAWPRKGLTDRNGNPLDWTISAIATGPIISVVMTTTPHLCKTGDVVFLFDTNSTPSIDGARAVTVISPTTFSVTIATTVAGTKGGAAIIPQELKDTISELAGQLSKADRTLDSDIAVQGITAVRAGSVSVNFKDMVEAQVIPDVVWALMPDSWITDELIEPAYKAEFNIL